MIGFTAILRRAPTLPVPILLLILGRGIVSDWSSSLHGTMGIDRVTQWSAELSWAMLTWNKNRKSTKKRQLRQSKSAQSSPNKASGGKAKR
jgi:hypothetical protein